MTETLTQCIRYQQMYICMCTIIAYVRDSLTHMRQVAIHTMDYVDAATTNISIPYVRNGAKMSDAIRALFSFHTTKDKRIRQDLKEYTFMNWPGTLRL